MPYNTLPGDEGSPPLGAEELAAEAAEQDRFSDGAPDEATDACVECFNPQLLSEFDKHAARLRSRATERRKAVQLKSAVLDREERSEQSADATLGRKQPQDEFQVRSDARPVHPVHPVHPSPCLTLVRCHAFCTGRCQHPHAAAAAEEGR